MLTKDYKIIESFTTGVFIIDTWQNGIIHVKVAGNTIIDASDIKEQYDYLKTKFNSKKYIILVESGENSSLTKEAREFSTLPETNSMTLGTAVIIKSLAERLIINFMINILNQQTMKLKMFENKEKAIAWLLSLKQN